jgi:hypothetical protein
LVCLHKMLHQNLVSFAQCIYKSWWYFFILNLTRSILYRIFHCSLHARSWSQGICMITNGNFATYSAVFMQTICRTCIWRLCFVVEQVEHIQ